MSNHPLDEKRIAYLLSLLRQRTPEEITTGAMAFAGSFTPEMWRALELLHMERSASKGQRPLENKPGVGASKPTVSADDEV